MKKKLILTDAQWREVFRIRCLSKRGLGLSSEDRNLIDAAWKSDPVRYEAMSTDVFNETVPFGSSLQLKKR